MLRHPTPWKTRPETAIKGYIIGTAVAGWSCAAAMVPACMVTDNSALLLLGLIYAFLGALATYMWRHG